MLTEFYNWHGTEQTAADPLIVGGDELVPLLIEKIRDPSMPKRNVAIGYLCRYVHVSAIPIVRTIIENESEHEVDRSVALYSMAYIQPDLAKKLADKYADRQDSLGKTSRDLKQNGVASRSNRSYTAAYLSYISNGAIQIESE